MTTFNKFTTQLKSELLLTDFIAPRNFEEVETHVIEAAERALAAMLGAETGSPEPEAAEAPVKRKKTTTRKKRTTKKKAEEAPQEQQLKSQLVEEEPEIAVVSSAPTDMPEALNDDLPQTTAEEVEDDDLFGDD